MRQQGRWRASVDCKPTAGWLSWFESNLSHHPALVAQRQRQQFEKLYSTGSNPVRGTTITHTGEQGEGTGTPGGSAQQRSRRPLGERLVA